MWRKLLPLAILALMPGASVQAGGRVSVDMAVSLTLVAGCPGASVSQTTPSSASALSTQLTVRCPSRQTSQTVTLAAASQGSRLLDSATVRVLPATSTGGTTWLVVEF